ncbi:MAG: hypothetical protein NC541_14770 [bacterium]|nr:hypothetical protein [bacterium]
MKIVFFNRRKEVRSMFRKIHQELAAIRKELRTIKEAQDKYTFIKEPYSGNYRLIKVETDSSQPMEWRRFELMTDGEDERIRLERVIREHCLSRRDLAIILLGLRVRPGLGKKDLGI